MTTPTIDPEIKPVSADPDENESRKRRWLLLLLLLLLLLCCCVGYFFINYLRNPQPLPEMLPEPIGNAINYPPTYKFSINNVDRPVGVAVSPDGQRIYVAESGGERLVKMFDRDGNLIKSFFPTGTTKSTRNPRYIAVDPQGRVYLVDRLNNVIHLFDADGNYLDIILSANMTATKLLADNISGGAPAGTTFSYEGINRILTYQAPGQSPKQIKVPEDTQAAWNPLGIRFDQQGDLLYSDLTGGAHSIHIIPAADLSGSWTAFNPQIKQFGVQGKDPGQFEFPQVAVRDSKGNFYVADGNNYRVSAWTSDLKYSKMFGFGSTEGGLNLPRGMWMTSNDHLLVADSVASSIRVYDVSGAEPTFLYNFGLFGITEGAFNYPNDLCMDGTGRVYIADSANNRIQIWSY